MRVQFTEEGLSSYSGLELFRQYVRQVGLSSRIRHYLGREVSGGDFGSVALCRVVVGLLILGGRRLRHLAYLKGDAVFHRFCGLKELPVDRTVSRWLKGFTVRSVAALRRLNAEVVARVLALHLTVRTLTIDVDGTVLSTGMKVAWAFRGYNPHHRKVPSYFPISAYLAESGHVLRLQNRPGNVNDGKASLPFLRELFGQIRTTLGDHYRLRFRMDGDYFKREIVRLLESKHAGYAIKVPFWRCVDLQRLIRQRTRWLPVEKGVDGFPSRITVKAWNRHVSVCIFRKRVHHPTRKNYQLDLFDPTNGTWEYSAVATNIRFDVRRLWRFMCGRGLHEKTLGDLKSGLALDSIPTNHYAANSAWQQFVVLAHNLLVNFQIQTGSPTRHPTQKRTALWILKRATTLRFELFCRAGRLVRPLGIPILRLLKNEKAKSEFLRIAENLRKAA